MITSWFAHSIPPSWACFQGKISDCIQYQRALRESTGRIPFPKNLCTNFWMSERGLLWAIPKMGTSSDGSNKNKTWKDDEASGFRKPVPQLPCEISCVLGHTHLGQPVAGHLWSPVTGQRSLSPGDERAELASWLWQPLKFSL